MLSSSVLLILGTLVVTGSWAAPAQDDFFSAFLKNIPLSAPNKESDVVKRGVYEENPDSSLKQISLRALIEGLERGLYHSAMSVSSVGRDSSATLAEITPATTDHSATKRATEDDATEQLSGSNVPHGTTESSRVVLQTTERVPEKAGYPGHILIDRISVQPYFSGIPIIPAFQVHHSKLIPDGANATTQISITKKTIQTTPIGIEALTPTSTSTQIATDAASSSTAATTSTTTPNLNKAEAELKEKVAEIEAEPVILSARI